MTTCTAHGTHGGAAWSCDRRAIIRGLCDGHRRQEERGRPLTPLRERLDGPAFQITVRILESQRELLGDQPSTRASEILRDALVRLERRKKRDRKS